jgi:carbamoyltransferase
MGTAAIVGISGAKRNACAAACVDGEIVAVCEQERLTRIRAVGLTPGTMPFEAVDKVMRRSKTESDAICHYVVAEREIRLPAAFRTVELDHHRAHAATSFLTSPFDRAAVIVCDSNRDREFSLWLGDGGRLNDYNWPWRGHAFATVYSECAKLFEEGAGGGPHALEVLAHLGRGTQVDQLHDVFRHVDGALDLATDWRAQLHQMIQAERQQHGHAREAASAIQGRLGELLIDVLADIRAAVEVDAVCLAGGLFYNTFFATLVRSSGIFSQVFVPANPGNAGLAVGGALLVGRRNGNTARRATLSPFLGPEYDAEAIKHTLDGCKLSYEYVSEEQALDATVTALQRGQLVAWFQGRMEWGHRALGHRSILASPNSPYVLDNLNFFLRKRERSRPFGVAVCAEAVSDVFCGPAASPFMEYEYRLRDDRLRHVMPEGASTIRVQTVDREMSLFHSLLQRVTQAKGTGVLVNTSFNAFHEPIVCSPRDAVRVFFGTGLDMLVIGRFILRK